MVGNWIGKFVFLKTQDDRIYNGNVIGETQTTLTINDKFGCMVELSKIDIRLCQEEVKNGH